VNEVTNTPPIKVATMGQVDHGKSTLVGYMMYALDVAARRELRKLAEIAEQLRKADMKFAFLMDRNRDERESGESHRTVHATCRLGSRRITFVDNPGHEAYVHNLITGVSQVDSGLLVVDGSSPREYEIATQAFTKEVQGKRPRIGYARVHAIVARQFGVRQVVVAISKMDRADYSERSFLAAQEAISDMLTARDVGFSPEQIVFVPTAVLVEDEEAENVLEPSKRMPWASSQTLAAALERLPCPKDPVDAPFRFAVSKVYYRVPGTEIVVTGRVLSGRIGVSDRVQVTPGAIDARVSSIEAPGGRADQLDAGHLRWKRTDTASAGELAGLALRMAESSDSLRPGCVLCNSGNPLVETSQVSARVSVLIPLRSLRGGTSRLGIRIAGFRSGCTLGRVIRKESNLWGEKANEDSQRLDSGDIAEVEIKLDRPIAIDRDEPTSVLNRLVLLGSYGIAAAGGQIIAPRD